ncbi:ANTAR domain-containing protein [Kineococcus sp. SYSU DK006]|uniref:ANTAR domain-containing protein n=1 Tax=Kineococcus sp. SYSU DK006 TaxID=3383127 RepID=UPI003D7C67F7
MDERLERFLAAHGGPGAAPTGPDALAAACRDALGADGAVVAVAAAGRWRLPVGVSDPVAGAAERWRFTVGEGPSSRAEAGAEPVVADEARLRRSWPALHDQLRRHTAFRSALALPLLAGAAPAGTLDLYWRGPRAAGGVDLAAAQRVASLTASRLLAPAGTGAAGPAWLDAPSAQPRQRTWVAISMVTQVLGLDDADALAVLRSHAYARDRTLEQVADDVVAGRASVGALRRPAED